MRLCAVWLLCLAWRPATHAGDFAITEVHRSSNGWVSVTWPALSCKNYQIAAADSPAGPWTNMPSGSLVGGIGQSTLTYTDSSALTATQRFYHVQTTRLPVVMTLVLDRSGSMIVNGGSVVLHPSVAAFVDLFDDAVDRVSVVSFAATATLDLPMQQPFNNAVKAAVSNFVFSGSTFIQGGLTNAVIQNGSVTLSPCDHVTKVAVLFTDGMANIIQDTLNCGGTPTLRNFGGFDSGSTVAFFDPSNGNQLCSTSGGTPPCCPGVNQFRSAIDGQMKSFLRVNVSADAEFRAVQTAAELRAATSTVYVVGLGALVNLEFLRQVANDPAASTYDPGQPAGKAIVAASANDLPAALQSIAGLILDHP